MKYNKYDLLMAGIIFLFIVSVVGVIEKYSNTTPLYDRTATTKQFTNIEGLKDCKAFGINGSSILIIRCPNSSTTINYRDAVRRY
jgi:hypothetical protein